MWHRQRLAEAKHRAGHPDAVTCHAGRIAEEEERAGDKRGVEDVHSRSAEDLLADDDRKGNGQREHPSGVVAGMIIGMMMPETR